MHSRSSAMETLAVPAFTGGMTSTDPSTRPILVTGGTGKTGRRVADRLTAAGVAHRVASRRGTPPFDWDDPATWGPLLDGAGAAYIAFAPDLAFPGARDTVGAFAAEAVARGVTRLVLLSGRGEEEALATEKVVTAASPDTTIVRASLFAQDFSEHFLLEPVLSGVIALPAGDVAEPFVDLDDVADVAVAALTAPDGRHAGQEYEVTGPRLVTFADTAAMISAATGRDIAYVPVTAEEYRAAALAAGVPEEEVGPLTDLFTTVFDGRNESLADGVERALGRPARDFADYVRDTAATGVWVA
jgi:uncharacterized protein YbjT (DUF2867 family)